MNVGTVDDDMAAFADGTSFPSTAGTGNFWTAPVIGSNCDADGEPVTIYCTSDGSSTGAARHGTIRLWVKHADTAYSTQSDSGSVANYGVVRCNARISALTDGNTASSPSAYRGGDTLRSTITLLSEPYTSSTDARLDLACSAATNTVGSFQGGTSADTLDQALKGTDATWPDDCTLKQKLVVTKKSSISGLSTFDFFHWSATSPPSSVTFPDSLTASKDTKTLDRTPTPGGTCRTELPAGTLRVRIGAGKTITNTCTWTLPRGDLATGLAIGYTHRSSQPLTDTTDVPSVSTQSFSSGVLTYSPTISTSATDTNSTVPLDYVQCVEQYGASRTSGELYNYGCTTGLFDVARTLDLTDIQLYRNVCGGAYPSTVFWIDHHVVCSREGPVQDPEGNTYTTSLTFTRTYEAWDATFIASNSENGVTSGTSTTHYTVPQQTAGTWWYNVTVTDGLGNTGTRSETVTFTATDPGDTGGAVDYDPIKGTCVPAIAWPGQTAACFVSAAFLTGLPNTGSAANLPGWFNTSSGALLSGPVTPTEMGTGSGIYVYTYAIPANAPSQPVALSIAYGGDGTRGVGAFFILNDKIATETSVNITRDAARYGNDKWNTTYTAPDNAAAQHARDAARWGNQKGWNETFADVRDITLPALEDQVATRATEATAQQILAKASFMDANITTANNSASGALTQAAFNQWRDQEARPNRDTTNVTLYELRILQSGIESGFGNLGDDITLQAAATQAYLPAKWVESRWTGWAPPSWELSLVLLIGLTLTSVGALNRRKKMRWRASWAGGGIAMLLAYAYALGAFA